MRPRKPLQSSAPRIPPRPRRRRSCAGHLHGVELQDGRSYAKRPRWPTLLHRPCPSRVPLSPLMMGIDSVPLCRCIDTKMVSCSTRCVRGLQAEEWVGSSFSTFSSLTFMNLGASWSGGRPPCRWRPPPAAIPAPRGASGEERRSSARERTSELISHIIYSRTVGLGSGAGTALHGRTRTRTNYFCVCLSKS